MIFLKAGLISLCLFFYLPVLAGSPAKISSKNGVVILKNGERISGELLYFYKSDLIQIKMHSKVSKAYTPHQVDRFRFYDEKFDTDRVFVSVFAKDNNYGRYGFFEIISWGKFEVIGKLKFEDASHMSLYKNPRLNSNKVFVPKLISHDYFVLHSDDIIPLNEFKKQFLSKLCKKEEQISSFVKSEELNINDVYDQLKIIAFCNKNLKSEHFDMQEFWE